MRSHYKGHEGAYRDRNVNIEQLCEKLMLWLGMAMGPREHKRATWGPALGATMGPTDSIGPGDHNGARGLS